MKIAVTMRSAPSATYAEPRDGISHDWVRALERLGVHPVLVPNVLAEPAGFLRHSGARGLLLTGGDGVDGSGRSGGSERDRTEHALLDAAVEDGLPVFGVCRGLQVVNVHFGGRLTRDLAALGAHVATRHTVRIAAAPAAGVRRAADVVTNSFHDHGVGAEDVSSVLQPFGLAGDVVEALLHPALPIVAIQWHPERDNPAAGLDAALLGAFLDRCA